MSTAHALHLHHTDDGFGCFAGQEPGRLIARLGDSGFQHRILHRVRQSDGGSFGLQIHMDTFHTLHSGERLLHPGRAVSTAHALHLHHAHGRASGSRCGFCRLAGSRTGGTGSCRAGRSFGLGCRGSRRGSRSGNTGLKELEPQGIGDNAHRAEAHGGSGEHGVELESEGDKQHARSQRDADGVVEEGPEQILLDVADHRAGEFNGGDSVEQVALHQDDVGGFDGDIGAGADGNAHVRSCQGRGIVDAVADHGDLLALCLELAHFLLLILGENLRYHPVNAGLAADGFGGLLVVAGEHDHINAQLFELRNGLTAGGLHHIRHGDESDDSAAALSFPYKEERGLALVCQTVGLGFQFARVNAQGAEQAAVARMDGDAVHPAPDALTFGSAEVLGFGAGNSGFSGILDDGICQRMLRTLFHCRCQHHQFGCVGAAQGNHIGHPGLALGDGAGLIQNDRVHQMGGFQALGALDENAVFSALAGAHHDGHRSGKAQSAGTGDHQHRDADGEGKVKALPQQQPYNGGDEGDGHHSGDEHRRHLVCQLGNGSLGGGSLLHQADDLGQGGVVAHPGSPELDGAVLVDRGGDHPVVHRLFHRDALTGEGGFVHRGAPLQDHTVHRNALSGTDHHNIPGHDFLHRDLHLHAGALHGGSLGGQVHQFGDGFGGLALGAGLQPLAEGDQGQDGGGALKVEVHGIGHERRMVPGYKGKGDLIDDIDAIDHRCRGTHRDEGIHVGGAVPQGFEAGEEVVPVQIENGQGEQELGKGKGQRIVHAVQPAGDRQSHHAAHREIEQRYQENERPQELPLFGFGLLEGEVFRRFGAGGFLPGRVSGGSAVAGLLHQPGNIRRLQGGFIIVHHHIVSQQVHIHRTDALRFGKALFDVCRAGRTGHAGDKEFLFHGFTSTVSCRLTLPQGRGCFRL